MNKWTLKSLAAAVVGVVALAGQANAAVTYQYVAEKSQYQAASQGAAVTVNLYLLETLTGGSASVIAPEGLFAGGVKVTRTSGDGTLTAVTPNNTARPTNPNEAPPQSFGGPGDNGTLTPTGVAFQESVDPGVPQAGVGVTLGSTGRGIAPGFADRVFLGSVTVAAGTVDTAFAVQPYAAGGGFTFTNQNGYDVDVTSANPAFTGATSGQFTVVVPEPALAGMAVVLGAAGSLVRRRRTA